MQYAIISILCCCFSAAIAQTNFTGNIFSDSIMQKYKQENQLSKKQPILLNYITKQQWNDPGKKTKALHLGIQQLTAMHEPFGADFLRLLVTSEWQKAGGYDNVFKECAAMLPMFEERKDTFALQYALNNIANSLSATRNNEQSVFYLHRALKLAVATGEAVSEVTILNNIADNYLKQKKTDSALLYIMQARQGALRLRKNYLSALVYSTMCEVYLAAANYSTAITIGNQAVAYATTDNDLLTISYNYCNMGYAFYGLHKMDSCIRYAQSAYRLALPDNLPEMQHAAELLYKSYKQINSKDSMINYFETAVSIKDTLYNAEKLRRLQQLHFAEQIRENEMQEAEQRKEAERLQNLQMMGIALFVITLGTFVFVIKRKRLSSSFVDILGVVAVLLLFEFVSMLLHPFLEKITHHNPFLMLLCLMLIGAVLAPLHHKMTGLVKNNTQH